MTVHNDGPTPDPGPVTVTDTLPAGLTFASGTADGWACAAAGTAVTCERDGDFAVDATDVITLTVDVGAKAYPTVSNTAEVSTPSNDTDPADDTSTIESPVDGSAVLTIDKSLDSQKGDKAVWEITVTNDGPTETTKAIRVTDKLPKGLKYVSATGEGWDCSARGRVVTCDYDGALAVDESASIKITTTITVDDGSEIVNVATVEGGNKAVDSGVLSDDATATAPSAEDDNGLIPDTGGPALWLLLAGLLSVLGGGVLVARRRPKSPQVVGKHL
ncbi:LPXTG cell wall anchor domain-containing protein [Aeromicrobium sp. UC242_57]|uniref:LPXTG cell wall anchor domain-containing protein n=1 Tax=Aeromicrobium sp. UC242_57 TaxID=3374624 RepID=UPI0037AC7802